MIRFLAALFLVLMTGSVRAGVSCSLPFALTNGTVADASQVMANYNALVACLGNAAAAGANSDITSLSGITSPFTPAQGGSNVFIGPSPTTSGTNIGITTTLPSGFTNTTGYSVFFISPTTNAGTMTASIDGQAQKNIFKPTGSGPVALTGNELTTGNLVYMTYDGTEFQIFTTNGLASLSVTNQTLTGGANVTSRNLGTINGGGSVAVNCGNGPLQFFTNNGALTVSAPANDGSCTVGMVNAAGAGGVSFSGFTANANTGEQLDTVNGHIFFINIQRIDAVSTYWIKALQ